jgi:tetratricopeptide (TPR) repeat protein
MRGFSWAFAVLLATASIAVAGDKRSQAVQLAEDSEKAYKAGHFEHAADLLRKAHELYPEPILLYNLGRALEGMGDAKNAIAAYERYLRDAKEIDDRGAIERRVSTLKAQIVREQHGPPPAPPDAPPEQQQPPQQQQQAPPHDDTLPSHDEPLPPRAVPMSGSQVGGTNEADRSTFLPWITIGAGGVVALTGALYGWRASTNHDDAVNEPSQQRAIELQKAATHDASIANVLFVAGGMIVIGGAVWEYFDWKHRDRASAQTTRLKLVPSGLALEWTFR